VRERIRPNLTYANVMATIAVFLVLGGGSAVAGVIINSNGQVAQNTISGHKPPSGAHPTVIAGSLNGTDLATGAVTKPKLANHSVSTGKFAAGATAPNAARLGGVAPRPAYQPLQLHAGCSSKSSVFSPPGYVVDALGFVHLRGVITCTTYMAFQLPAAIAPGYRKVFRVATTNTADNTELTIFPDGTADLNTSGTSFDASLDGVTYRAGG
jgi:hypothetical protein